MSISHRPPLLRGHRPGRERHYSSHRREQQSHLLWLFLCAAGILVGFSVFQGQLRLMTWHARRANDAAARLSRYVGDVLAAMVQTSSPMLRQSGIMRDAPTFSTLLRAAATTRAAWRMTGGDMPLLRPCAPTVTSRSCRCVSCQPLAPACSIHLPTCYIQELACSLKRTNPHLPLIVYAVPGELSPHVEAAVRNITELRYWKDLYFPSQRQDGRYAVLVGLVFVRCVT